MKAIRHTLLASCVAVAAVIPSWANNQGAVLVATVGTVQARTTEMPRWHPAAIRSVYMPGDALMTSRRSRAEVAFPDGTLSRLAPASILHIPQQSRESLGRLLLGRMWLKVAKQHSPIAVHTPAAVASVVGTELIVSVDGEDNAKVMCLEGRVNVQGLQGAMVPLKGGYYTEVRMGASADPPQAFDVKRLRATDPLLASLKQDRVPDDDDPEGYKSLMQQLRDNALPSDAPPPPDTP